MLLYMLIHSSDDSVIASTPIPALGASSATNRERRLIERIRYVISGPVPVNVHKATVTYNHSFAGQSLLCIVQFMYACPFLLSEMEQPSDYIYIIYIVVIAASLYYTEHVTACILQGM